MVNDKYLNHLGLSLFFNKLKLLFATKDELRLSSDGTSEVVQLMEPSGQKSGDFWIQEYT